MKQTHADSLSARIGVSGLVKKYQYQPVLDQLSLTVEDGDLCVLVGANGAGKTTLLRILAGLVRADTGQILLGSVPLRADPGIRKQIGYIGHASLFYNDLNALENLTHYARLYHINPLESTVVESIRSVGLEPHQHKPLRTYSRGMGQRLAIARALLHDPAILLFDEPYTGLDQEGAAFLDDRLRRLQGPSRAILLAAHRPQRLLQIATHIAWLREGKIVQHLPVNRLSEAPELRQYLQETA